MDRARWSLAAMLALSILFCCGLAHASDGVMYSDVIDLRDYMLRDEPTEASASESAMHALTGDVSMPETAVHAQFILPTVSFLLEPEGAVVFQDRGLSGFFSLRVGTDGRCYLDTGTGGVPRVTLLDQDCIAPPYQRSILCDSYQLSRWGWRVVSVGDAIAYDEAEAYMTLGAIDPVSGELIGYAASPDRESTVYIAYQEPVHRYEVAYHDVAGTAVAHGPLFALGGSDLRQLPAVSLPIPDGGTFKGFVYLGTESEATSSAAAPARLQLAMEDVCAVTLMVDGAAYGDPMWVASGHAIDWDRVTAPEPPLGWVFTGWTIAGGGVFEPQTLIVADITLTARFTEATTVTLYPYEGAAAPFASMTVAVGQSVDLGAIRPQQTNRRFTGWYDVEGTQYMGSVRVDADMALSAGYEPYVSDAAFFAYDACNALADDTENGYVSRSHVVDIPALHYDAELDDYYLLARDLRVSPVEDRFGNAFLFELAPEAWQWGYAEAEAGHAFIVRDGRWYLGVAMDAEALSGPRLYVRYRDDVRFHMVYFYDGDARLPVAFPALEGGNLSLVLHETGPVSLLPPERAAIFDGWAAFDGQTGNGGIDRPVRLAAQYKAKHTVAFFLDASDATPWHTVEVVNGSAMDWSQLPEPSVPGKRFVGWMTRQGKPVDPDARVTGPLQIQADFVRLLTVTLADAQGRIVRAIVVDEGGSVDVTGVEGPSRDGLEFAGWLTADGRQFTPEMLVTADVMLAAGYVARVTFMDGAAVHAVRMAPEGGVIGEMPEEPQWVEGRAFLGWDTDVAGKPIAQHTTVRAKYMVDVTFVFGLYGEFRRVVPVPAGAVAAPPDASIYGYRYDWSVDVGRMRFTQPTTVVAHYEEIRYWEDEEDGDVYANPEVEGDELAAYYEEDFYPEMTSLPWFDGGYMLDTPMPEMPSYDSWNAATRGGLYDIPEEDIPLYGAQAGERGECFE